MNCECYTKLSIKNTTFLQKIFKIFVVFFSTLHSVLHTWNLSSLEDATYPTKWRSVIWKNKPYITDWQHWTLLQHHFLHLNINCIDTNQLPETTLYLSASFKIYDDIYSFFLPLIVIDFVHQAAKTYLENKAKFGFFSYFDVRIHLPKFAIIFSLHNV